MSKIVVLYCLLEDSVCGVRRATSDGTNTCLAEKEVDNGWVRWILATPICKEAQIDEVGRNWRSEVTL